MAEPRKTFRIEETTARRIEESLEETQAGLRHAELLHELAALRAALAAAASRQPGGAEAAPAGEAARLTSELNLIQGAISGDIEEHSGQPGSRGANEPMTRIAHELNAVVNATETATQKILAAAEEIDQVANNLSAALKGKIEQGLAQDIQDLVIRIFEACNFQDVAGQRVTKVMATLTFIEDHITRVLEEIKNASTSVRRDGSQYLHGPRLEIDGGHASQGDVDAMFGGAA
jgi:chemotaxis protein CheZ